MGEEEDVKPKINLTVHHDGKCWSYLKCIRRSDHHICLILLSYPTACSVLVKQTTLLSKVFRAAEVSDDFFGAFVLYWT